LVQNTISKFHATKGAQNSLSLPNPVYDYPVHGLVTVVTELSRLHISK